MMKSRGKKRITQEVMGKLGGHQVTQDHKGLCPGIALRSPGQYQNRVVC